MYSLVKVRETIRVPPKEFSSNLKEAILKIVQEDYEGLVDEDLGVVIAVTGVEKIGEGKIVPGDAAAYHEALLSLLVYKPVLQEVIEGFVSETTEFGAFVRISPIEGLVHVSQIMDDYINYDAKLPGFIGKKTGKRLVSDDTVLVRIVTVSLKDTISNSKIGLTMRQPLLGKEEWQRMDEKSRKKEEKKPEKRIQQKTKKDA